MLFTFYRFIFSFHYHLPPFLLSSLSSSLPFFPLCLLLCTLLYCLLCITSYFFSLFSSVSFLPHPVYFSYLSLSFVSFFRISPFSSSPFLFFSLPLFTHFLPLFLFLFTFSSSLLPPLCPSFSPSPFHSFCVLFSVPFTPFFPLFFVLCTFFFVFSQPLCTLLHTNNLPTCLY